MVQVREAQQETAVANARLAEQSTEVTALKVQLEKLKTQRELEQKARMVEAEVILSPAPLSLCPDIYCMQGSP